MLLLMTLFCVLAGLGGTGVPIKDGMFCWTSLFAPEKAWSEKNSFRIEAQRRISGYRFILETCLAIGYHDSTRRPKLHIGNHGFVLFQIFYVGPTEGGECDRTGTVCSDCFHYKLQGYSGKA